jgi:hypothetical protein
MRLEDIMFRYGKMFSILLITALLTSVIVSPTMANSAKAGEIQSNSKLLVSHGLNEAGSHLLSSTSAGVVFEVNVPWEQLSLQSVTSDGKGYVRVSMPGWAVNAQTGSPALPVLVEQIGAPFGVSVNVRVIPGKAHTQVLSAAVLPVATQTIERNLPPSGNVSQELPVASSITVEDPGVYDSASAYPGKLGEVTNDGVLRQQRVLGITVYPVQYFPTSKQLTVYEYLKVEITFQGTPDTLPQISSSDSGPYENVLKQDLLNYEGARAWRQSAAVTTMPLKADISGTGLPWAPPVPGWRIKVRSDGFYKITYAELTAAGFPVNGTTLNLDPRTLQLFNLGNEVALDVEGEADGKFDQTDTILFYGQGIASKYSADNVYWLTYGKASGLRMGSRDGTPEAAVTPTDYPAKTRVEENHYYFSNAPGDENLERWLMDYIYAPSRPSWTHIFTLAAPYSAGPATLKLSMVGYLDNPINPDHHVVITLNGTQLGEAWWDGINWKTLEVAIPPGVLLTGANTLLVTCPNDTGAQPQVDVVYIDWAELDFSNTFLAESNQLAFTYDTPGMWRFQVSGFSANQVDIFDVTSPGAPVRITGVAISGAGPYSVDFQDTVTATTNYWAAASTTYLTVQAIEKDTPSTLQSSSNGADYIVITHPDFMTAATTLSNFRASQGLRTMTVNVQDVYDEFGYGIVGAGPIHDFLAYAYASWQSPAPAYVVLVGDGNYDPKNYAGNSKVSYMPPYLAPVDPWILETAADNRYVTLAGADTLPDMMLGRLSVNTPAEASIFVNKIISYEQSPVQDNWRQKVLAVADNADPAAGDFAQESDGMVACCILPPYQVQKVYLGVTHLTAADARAAIQSGINSGILIVNYIGHASSTAWAAENLFSTSDVPLLTNGGMLPVVLAMTCREGYFIYPDPYSLNREALAEVVTRADGRGAVASWSPTGLGVTSGHDYLDQGFLTDLFSSTRGSIGQATNAGKLSLWSSGISLDLLDTFLLFGDPALQLPPASLAAEIFMPFVLR